jgi:hypothetical protein
MQHWKSKITFSRWSSIYFQNVFVGKFESALEIHSICGKKVKDLGKVMFNGLGDVLTEQQDI